MPAKRVSYNTARVAANASGVIVYAIDENDERHPIDKEKINDEESFDVVDESGEEAKTICFYRARKKIKSSEPNEPKWVARVITELTNSATQFSNLAIKAHAELDELRLAMAETCKAQLSVSANLSKLMLEQANQSKTNPLLEFGVHITSQFQEPLTALAFAYAQHLANNSVKKVNEKVEAKEIENG